MPTNKLYTAQDFANLFSSIGVKKEIIPFLVAQVALETGDFKSKLLYDHNNASGIVYIGKPATQKNAKKGRVLPEDKRYNYAMFDTLKDWGVDYVRVLNRGKIKPLEATTIDEYANALKQNKYFSADFEAYKKILVAKLKKYKDIAPVAGAGIVVLLAAAAAWLLIK